MWSMLEQVPQTRLGRLVKVVYFLYQNTKLTQNWLLKNLIFAVGRQCNGEYPYYLNYFTDQNT